MEPEVTMTFMFTSTAMNVLTDFIQVSQLKITIIIGYYDFKYYPFFQLDDTGLQILRS